VVRRSAGVGRIRRYAVRKRPALGSARRVAVAVGERQGALGERERGAARQRVTGRLQASRVLERPDVLLVDDHASSLAILEEGRSALADGGRRQSGRAGGVEQGPRQQQPAGMERIERPEDLVVLRENRLREDYRAALGVHAVAGSRLVDRVAVEPRRSGIAAG